MWTRGFEVRERRSSLQVVGLDLDVEWKDSVPYKNIVLITRGLRLDKWKKGKDGYYTLTITEDHCIKKRVFTIISIIEL